MNLKDIPVVTIGPGSQPTEADGANLSYIDMPSDMSTYRRPTVEGDDIGFHAGAREAMAWLATALSDYQLDGEPRIADLTALDHDSRVLINELLGEGEVGATLSGEVNARSQESVLTGVWRTVYLDDEGRVTHDLLEVGEVPYFVRESNVQMQVTSFENVVVPEGVINAKSILVELKAATDKYRQRGSVHTINLTLLPMSDEDIYFLDNTLGKGSVEILSRSYGKCTMLATGVPNIWWVRYYNSMNTLILNSLEITDVPLVARAASEDLQDSAQRLAEILELEEPTLNQIN